MIVLALQTAVSCDVHAKQAVKRTCLASVRSHIVEVFLGASDVALADDRNQCVVGDATRTYCSISGASGARTFG